MDPHRRKLTALVLLCPIGAFAPAGNAQANAAARVVVRAGMTVDLTHALPASVPRGGVFRVEGPAPQQGVSLSPDGLLVVASDVSDASVPISIRYWLPL